MRFHKQFRFFFFRQIHKHYQQQHNFRYQFIFRIHTSVFFLLLRQFFLFSCAPFRESFDSELRNSLTDSISIWLPCNNTNNLHIFILYWILASFTASLIHRSGWCSWHSKKICTIVPFCVQDTTYLLAYTFIEQHFAHLLAYLLSTVISLEVTCLHTHFYPIPAQHTLNW
jgi:hypothetical protein